MIARVWHGWTSAANADAYEQHFQSEVLRHLDRVNGFRGAQLWRREHEAQVEFVAVTTFDSNEAVRGFAGSDYERAVVEPEARRLLNRFDERCAHYQVAVEHCRAGGGTRVMPGSRLEERPVASIQERRNGRLSGR